MDQIINRLPATLVIHDNICIFVCTLEEHDEYLLQLMQVAMKNRLVFNKSKCKIRQPEISAYGTELTYICMKPDHSKVQTFQDLPTFNNQTKLQ